MPNLETWELAGVYVVGFGGFALMLIAAVRIVLAERAITRSPR